MCHGDCHVGIHFGKAGPLSLGYKDWKSNLHTTSQVVTTSVWATLASTARIRKGHRVVEILQVKFINLAVKIFLKQANSFLSLWGIPCPKLIMKQIVSTEDFEKDWSSAKMIAPRPCNPSCRCWSEQRPSQSPTLGKNRLVSGVLLWPQHQRDIIF